MASGESHCNLVDQGTIEAWRARAERYSGRLARMSWEEIPTRAKAYWLTGREQLITELLALWYHWQKENSYPIGVNWASSLEVAFRSLSWLWVRHLLAECRVVPQRFWADLTRALALNGRHI